MTDENPKILEVRPITRAEYIDLLSKHAEAGNALVAAGLVEDGLEKLLLHAARPLSNTLTAKIFDGLGPLSQFSAKIEIAYIFCLVDEATYKDLLAIKEIRNRFAHTSRFVNFKSEEIDTACQRLSGWKKGADNENLYLEKTRACVDKMNEKINALVYVNALQNEPGRSREKKT
jgi:DNA-binding MltR family transcriptional regulator